MAGTPSKRGKRATLESPLSATWRRRERERAVLVGVGRGMDESRLDELAALADTAGAEPVARVVQSRSDPDPATFVGKGKISEIHDAVHRNGADAVVLDDELSAGQLRNLEERLGTKVIDRTALILDIFALHARSREGKAQVELAQLNYLLPRLRGWGEAMSRLGAGIGTRGPGETKLEIDRQHIKRRITRLKRDIKDLERTRSVKRSRRESSGVPQIAIAGYTNAGKSTLMNALTQAEVLVADQLFATLDPTTRRITLPGGRHATLSDTVGFVSKLPHDLVEAFRSTLEEVTLADLVVHVADGSSRELDEQLGAVREVLGSIGAADVPEVLAINKADLLTEEEVEGLRRRHPDAVVISAAAGSAVDELAERLASAIPVPPIEVTLVVPYGREDVVASVYRNGEVLDAKETDDGTRLHARILERDLAGVADFLQHPVRREISTGFG
jgi:GTP-binding protein HflX